MTTPTPTLMPTAARLLLATLALALAACGSKEGRVESGLQKGADFVREADWDKANVEVRNVLQIDPRNARAYFIAAKVSEGQREPQRAYVQYLKAVELKPDLTDAKVGLARLYLFNGEQARADTAVKEVLAADPRHVDARTLQAALLAREGKAAEAMAIAKDVVAAGGTVPADTSLLLAGLHANQREWPKALAVLETALKADPRHLGLLQAAVELAAANPQDVAIAAKATGFYQRAAAESPKNHELWLAWARYHLSRKETDLAEKVLRDSIKAQPDDGKRRLALLDFLLSARGTEVAEKQYALSIAEKPRDMALRFGLVNLLRKSNRHAEAQKVLMDIVEVGDDAPNTLAARTQLAAYRLAAGKLDESRTLLTEVLKANPRDNAALVLSGRLHLMAGSPREAVVDLRGALRDQPGAVDIVQLLAQAHRAAGEPQLAREVLADAVKAKSDDPTLRALLAADMADAKDFKGAHAELDAAIKALPQVTRLYEVKAQLAVTQKDFALARKTLEQLKAVRPADITAYVRLGQLYSSQNKTDAALKEYDAAAAAAPADSTPYVAAVSLLSALKRSDEAMARIQTRAKADPANTMLHEQLSGEVAMSRRDFASAEKAYRAAIAAAPSLPAGYVNLAKALAANGDTAGALATLADAEKTLPGERILPLARAERLTRLQRNDEALALYETLRTRFPEDETVLNNLAYLLAEVKGDKVSIERALTLASRFAVSRNPGQLDSLGWIHYRLGQYDKAVPLLEKAVALAPPTPLLELHLGKALVKNGETARGKALIQRAIDSKADLPRLDEARALLAQG